MKKFLLGLLVVFALLAAGILLLPKLVPVDSVAAKVREQVKQATGRDVDFSGVKFVLWPNLGVELTGVTLSNPVWAKEKNMITLGKADIALALSPLLHRHIEVKRFVLNAPVIHLETGSDGKHNWDFSKEKSAPAEAEGAGTATPKGFDIAFGQMQITDGQLTFGAVSVDHIDVTASLPDLMGALNLKGALTYKQKRVNLTLGLEHAMDFMQGSASPGHMDIKTEDVAVKAGGVFATQGELLNGTVEATVASLSGVQSWLGSGSGQKPPFEKVSFNSAAAATKTDITLKNASLTLDDVRAQGNLSVGFAGRPDIFARLSVSKLALDRFTGAKGEAAAAEPADKKSEDWDATPMDFSSLRSVNADLELKTEGFSIKGADVGPSILTVLLQDGKLHFKSSEAALFGGKFSSDLTLDAASSLPKTTFNFDMAGVQAKPVLETFAHFKKLSGGVEAHVSVSSEGNSQKALVGGMNGNGSVVFKNGALEGIDLLKIAQLVQKHQADLSMGSGKTEFVELGGLFTISKGIASNSDMKMKSVLLQATGRGTIDFPRKYVQYRVTPVLLASADATDASGVAIPVMIDGPFSNIKAKPDFAAVAEDAIKNPGGMMKGIREQGKAIRGNLKGLGKDPLKALQGLFGQQAAEPAPAPATEPTPQPLP